MGKQIAGRTKNISFFTTEVMYDELKEVAEAELIDMSAAIRRAIEFYVRRHRGGIYQIDLPVNIIRETE